MSHILLDFDGVIVKNKYLNDFITTKSNLFVQKYYNKKQLYKCKKINKHFYKTYGHTALGFNPIKKKDYTQDILDYNEFVFSDINYDHIKDHITFYDICNIKKLLTYKSKFGLFTNAPISWCENICSITDTDIYEFIDFDKCFTSDNGLVKPNRECYEIIEEKLIYDDTVINFIDDSYINFKNISSNDKWNPIIFDSNIMTLTDHLNNLLH